MASEVGPGQRGGAPSQGRSGEGAPRVVAQPVIDIYARLSRAINGETIEVEDQVELCEAEIEARGALVGRVYKDNSLSAWNPKVERPDWNELMRRIEAGESDGVMVYDLHRFSRKVIEGERMIEVAANGARVWSLSGEYRLTTADGRAAFRDAMVKAAGESDKTSERVKLGKRRRAKKGRSNGGWRSFAMPGLAPRPEGWERGDLRELVPAERVLAERAVARECIERIVAGEKLYGLVSELNARAAAGELGCTTSIGGRWTTTTLARVLRHPSIAGILTFLGEEKGPLTGIESVVERAEWEKAAALLNARRTGRPAVDRHILTGRMECGRCGRPMRAHVRSSHAPYDDGEIRRSYVCRKTDPTDSACGHNTIDARFAEKAVKEAVVARLGDPDHKGRAQAQRTRVDEARAVIQGEINRWDDEADELSSKVVAWGVKRVNKQMEPILAKIEALHVELDAIEIPDTVESAHDDAVALWAEAEEANDVEALRRLIRYAFPNLTLAPHESSLDRRPSRFLWNGSDS